MNTYVYALVDPREPHAIRYVGNTVARLNRHLQHITCLNKSAKSEWLEQLREAGLFPQMITLETVPVLKGPERERYWIEHYRKAGMALLNHTYNANKEYPDKIIAEQVSDLRRERFEQALDETRYNVTQAARKLGISRPTAYDIMAKYGLKKPLKGA